MRERVESREGRGERKGREGRERKIERKRWESGGE